MLSGLLNSLSTLDYILLVTKATEVRLSNSSKFIFKQIEKMYANDLSERVLGLFTFSDGAEPQGYTAVKAAGINMAQLFKFNNSAMYTSKKDTFATQFFEMGQDNFELFCNYIKTEDKVPVSL